MQRRGRSGIADTEEEVAALSIAELNAEIDRCLSGYETGGTSQGRKAFFKRLAWLEGLREELHALPCADVPLAADQTGEMMARARLIRPASALSSA
jgi:hypothetical protein